MRQCVRLLRRAFDFYIESAPLAALDLLAIDAVRRAAAERASNEPAAPSRFALKCGAARKHVLGAAHKLPALLPFGFSFSEALQCLR